MNLYAMKVDDLMTSLIVQVMSSVPIKEMCFIQAQIFSIKDKISAMIRESELPEYLDLLKSTDFVVFVNVY